MANRSQGTTVLSNVDKKWFRTSIVEIPALWIVVYNGKPFKITRDNLATDLPVKYNTNYFTLKGKAESKARGLNKMFDTTGFTVVPVVI